MFPFTVIIKPLSIWMGIGVFLLRVNLKLFSKAIIPTLDCSLPNLKPTKNHFTRKLYLKLTKYLPMQVLGPAPNGKKLYSGLLALFSSENLSGSKTSGLG